MMEALPPLTTFDWAVLAGFLLSILIGLWRGLLFEVLSLLSWWVAWWGAQSFSAGVAAQLPWGAADSVGRAMGAYALVFIVTLLICGGLARLARLLVAATPLSLADRFFGAVFGLLRGVLIALVITTLVLRTPLVKSEVWKASWMASTLTGWVRQLQPLFPQWTDFKAWRPDPLKMPSAPSLF